MPTETQQTPETKRHRIPPIAVGGVAVLLAAAAFLLWSGPPLAEEESPSPPAEETAEPAPTEPDLEPPIIEGAQDLVAVVGETLSYRAGVTASDNVDGAVKLQVDASQVDLARPGEYPVIYSAADAQGNRAEVTITLTVLESEPGQEEPEVDDGLEAWEVTQEELDALADRILGQITREGMSKREIAQAIYTYVNQNIRYVGASDKSSWVKAAYIGFTRGRGDCYNYFACSKELLTRAGISNVDLRRVGGNTSHYWQLVNVGEGWYHFDACPHPNSYPLYSFLLTEAEVREYSERCKSVRLNYYVYDYTSCPVEVVGTPVEELPPEETNLEESPEELPPEESPEETVPAELPPEDSEAAGEEETQLPPEVSPEQPPETEFQPTETVNTEEDTEEGQTASGQEGLEEEPSAAPPDYEEPNEFGKEEEQS